MKRRLLSIVTFLSLALCVAVIVLWVRSYSVNDVVLRVVEQGDAHYTTGYLKSAHGTLSAQWIDYSGPLAAGTQPAEADWRVQSVPLDREDRLPQLRFMDGGFRVGPYGYGHLRGGVAQYRVAVPHWAAMLLSLLLPAALLGTRWVRRRRMSGIRMCRNCGYALRATPERCPECGTVEQQGSRKRSSDDQSVPVEMALCRIVASASSERTTGL